MVKKLKQKGVFVVLMVKENKKQEISKSEELDLKLISKIIDGDIDSFELLINKYQKPVFNSAYRYVGDFHEAEDLTQEIFVKVYKNISKFKGNSKFSTWLFSVAMNHLRSKRKKIKELISSVVDLFTFDYLLCDKNKSIEKTLETKELMKEVEKEIIKLPEIYREMIILRDINEFSYKEISTILDVNVDTVKTRIKRGRNMIVSNLRTRGY